MDSIRELLAQYRQNNDGVSARTKSEIKKNDDFVAGVGVPASAPAASAPAAGDQSTFTAQGTRPPLSPAAAERQRLLAEKLRQGK